MDTVAVIGIPQNALLRLEFLAGEYSGTTTMCPPGGRKTSYPACCNVQREVCDRFVRVEFVAHNPERGLESSTSFITFNTKKACYEMWHFSSSSEEPLHMTGDFIGSQLVMISDPWSMPWGLQRLRGTFTPGPDGDLRYTVELWEPDGFQSFRSTVLHKQPVMV